jgi:NAD(P)H-hydrate repair Nnr-like enzyme with NAD(P)H-hydrate dehydratase domain
MAAILGARLEAVLANATRCATEVARGLGATVVLKGAETQIVSPAGEQFVYRGGDVGLATSGSGDILAGIIAGLAARTSDPLQAAVWGVFVHGEAGNALAKKSGRVGYLARELLSQLPSILNRLSARA